MKFIAVLCVFLVFQGTNAFYNPFAQVAQAVNDAKNEVVNRAESAINSISIQLPTQLMGSLTTPAIERAVQLLNDAESRLNSLENTIYAILNAALNRTHSAFEDMSGTIAQNANSSKYNICSEAYNGKIKEQSDRSSAAVLDCGMREIENIRSTLNQTRTVLLQVNDAINTGNFTMSLATQLVSYSLTVSAQVAQLPTIQLRVGTCATYATVRATAEAATLAAQITGCFLTS